MSQYAYRNTPIWEPRQYGRSTTISVARTKPVVSTQLFAPAFKTQKLLGGRALVSDAFGKVVGLTVPGFAQYAHREGYNVLYGDYVARWFGDPQQRILWWNTSAYDPYYGPSQVWDYAGVSLQQDNQRLGSPAIWHTFDFAQGVDVDAPQP